MEKSDQQVEVLILVDNFSPELEPLIAANHKPWGFNGFHVFRFIDLCLEWVNWLESPNIVVAFANQPEEVAQQLKEKWSATIKYLQVITVPNAQSANDVLREVESKRLLGGDFLLVHNCATFCSSNLAVQIQNFRARKRQNKNDVLTLLYTNTGDEEKFEGENAFQPLIGYQTGTKKLTYHSGTSKAKSGKIRISKSAFLTETTFRSDLTPCGVWLCAHEFSGHFAGNYDFHSLDAIIQDILSNEEFLLQQIHVEIVENQKVLTISDIHSYHRVQKQLLERQCFPLTFDNVLPNFKDFERLELICKERNIYAPLGADCAEALQNDKLQIREVILGRHCQLGDGAILKNVTFGAHAKIGRNAQLWNVICAEGVQIDDNSNVENAFLAEHGPICAAAKSGKQQNEEEAESGSSSHDEDEAEQSEGEGVDVTYQGNSQAFVAEVLDSMQSLLEDGEEDGKKARAAASSEQLEKLKMEINASKLAYNISLEDFPRLVFLAFLGLPQIGERLAAFTKLFKEWSLLWGVYFKKEVAKVAMLQAIEEFAVKHEQFRRIVPNILHWLNQEEEFIDEAQILAWHKALITDSPLKEIPKLTEFIQWLEEADEEEDD